MPNTITAALEDGMLKTVAVKALADIEAPKVNELTAAGALDLSYYLCGDGFVAQHDQETVQDEREGSAVVGEIPGQEKYSNCSMQVIDNTNNDNDNDAVEQLVRGSEWYVIRRRGLPTDEEFKSGQKVSVYKIKIGIKTPIAHGINQRQMSKIAFTCDPASKDDESITIAANG